MTQMDEFGQYLYKKFKVRVGSKMKLGGLEQRWILDGFFLDEFDRV